MWMNMRIFSKTTLLDEGFMQLVFQLAWRRTLFWSHQGRKFCFPVCNLNDFNRLYSLQICAAHVFTIHFPLCPQPLEEDAMTWTAMSVILEAHQPSRALQLVVASRCDDDAFYLDLRGH